MARFNDYWNQKTGEQASAMLIIKGSRYPRGVEFATLFVNGLAFLANLGLTTTDWRVLAVMLAKMDFGNHLRLAQKSVADELKLAPSNVSGAVRNLIRLGIIAKQVDPKEPGRAILRISPHLAWRGTASEWSSAMMSGEGVGFAPIPSSAEKQTKPQFARRKPAAERRQLPAAETVV